MNTQIEVNKIYKIDCISGIKKMKKQSIFATIFM